MAKSLVHKAEIARRRRDRAKRAPGNFHASTAWGALDEVPTIKDGVLIPGKARVRRTFMTHPAGGYRVA